MDNPPDISTDLEDSILLNKVDSMLRRHRQEQSPLMQPVKKRVVTNPPDPMEQPFISDELSGELAEVEPCVDGIPVLTDQVVLTIDIDEWSSQTEISELLYFAFDAALREACISLNPAERLTLIQALRKRLPRNL